MNEDIVMSSLNKTWIFDIDGTIVKHNGYKIDGHDSLLPGSKNFIDSIDENDMIIFITSRTEDYKKVTIDFLKNNKIRYDEIIFNAPVGERVLINDKKPSGLNTAVAINTKRDKFITPKIIIDNKL